MDYCKNLDPKTFNNTQDYMLELVRQGLQAGYDLEDIAEHYKEKIQEEAAAIMKNTQHKELKEQIQKDLHNLAVIDRNKKPICFTNGSSLKLETIFISTRTGGTILPKTSKLFWPMTNKKKKPSPVNLNEREASKQAIC